QEAIDQADDVLKLDADNAEAKEIKAKAQEQMKPIMRVVAKVNGTDVKAALELNGAKYITPTIIDNDLTQGQALKGTLTYHQLNDYDYEGEIDTVVNWHGMKEMTVELKKVEGYRTMTLPGGVELKMVKVEAGSFMMGSNEGNSDEKPVHKVTLTKDFWLGETEVTQSQYEAVMGVNPSHFKKGGDYLVECVSWNDAMAFCRKLTELERKAGRISDKEEYTLPTEAQWEYAARGGNKSRRNYQYSGSDNLDEVGWYEGNSDDSTHPVRWKNPNELGLYDMSGNVWEWCLDWYGSYPNDAVTNPVGTSYGSMRVLRGGGFRLDIARCRSVYRFSNDPSLRYFLGFRVALVTIDSATSASSQSAAPKESETKGTTHPSVTEPTDNGIEYKTIQLPNGVELKMVKVAAGSFMMGSNDGDSDEKPVHKVTLTKDFWLGETEVTQSQYEAVMGRNPSYFKKGGNYPVERVSWNDAMAFCRKLTELERKAGRISDKEEYTLPTEAQWEYAARGGGKSKGYKYSGGDNPDEVGWHYGNSRRWWGDPHSKLTHPVKRKKPNELGLYDMSGNVWEWCLDLYDRYPNGAVTDPKGPSEGSNRVLRGGSWYSNAGSCRSANRGNDDPSDSYIMVGFRLALAPVQ
ncbi:MAG: SUMF1/EgtB/PvdO family nonheme iron enzyme, partial [Lentisphaeria bacterium]|nr:SUMF1/EgtB/PvdO family nonheme iron enzyme [Lentisphaeria bacterium]